METFQNFPGWQDSNAATIVPVFDGPATVVPKNDGPLTPEQHRVLALANQRAKKIRKAAGIARFNGWATAVFAVFSVPFTLFGFSLDALMPSAYANTVDLGSVGLSRQDHK